MTLYKLEEFYPNYQEELFDGDDIKGLDVYARKTGEKIGSIESALVDHQGRCQYFIIDSGFWIFGKKFLLPITHCQINEKAQRIYATGISNKKQVEKLPTYNNIRRISRNYEKQLRKAYHSSIAKSEPSRLSKETLTPLEASASLESTYSASKLSNFGDDKSRKSSQLTSVTPGNQPQSQSLKLYEERLVPNKIRHQAGEVIVSKHIEKENAKVSLPLKREKVVIERLNPTTTNTTITPFKSDTFGSQELTRIKIYEEIPDIQKQAFVREEVKIKKELEQDIVQAKATLRHEELDFNAQECNVIDRRRF